MSQLSKNLSLYEFQYSNTANLYGISNLLPIEYYPNARHVAVLFEIVRELLGRPCKLNSGFRSKELNDKLGEIGGYEPSKTSAHLTGRALDIACSKEEQEKLIKYFLQVRDQINFDQVIVYYKNNQDFVHVGVAEDIKNSRKMIGYKIPKGYTWI